LDGELTRVFREAAAMAAPYRSTAIFDETTLPSALRVEHRTKSGVWGVIRVIEGKLRLRLLDLGEDVILSPDRPGIVNPEQPHSVTPLGPMRMQVEFYDHAPE
jgi:tellurite resistance-related uncharacterized protein